MSLLPRSTCEWCSWSFSGTGPFNSLLCNDVLQCLQWKPRRLSWMVQGRGIRSDSDKENSAVALYSITVSSFCGDEGSLISLAGSPVDPVLFTTVASAPAAWSTALSTASLPALMAERRTLSVPSFPLVPVKTLCNYVESSNFREEAHFCFCLSSPSCSANVL